MKCEASQPLVKNTEDLVKVTEEQKLREVPAMLIGRNTTHYHCVGTVKPTHSVIEDTLNVKLFSQMIRIY